MKSLDNVIIELERVRSEWYACMHEGAALVHKLKHRVNELEKENLELQEALDDRDLDEKAEAARNDL